jgi:hypothetical protein
MIEYYKNISLENIEGEEWRDIPRDENRYQISNFGRIKSLQKIYFCGKKMSTKKISYEKILTQHFDSRNKYLIIRLSNKTKLVHRLVAISFIENTENKPCINHKDGIKYNNNSLNLEWAFHSENNLHSYRILGHTSPIKGKFLDLNPHSTKINQLTLDGEFIRSWNSIKEAANFYKLTSSSPIISAITGRTETSRGFKWEYLK